MYVYHKVVFVFECYIYVTYMHSYLLTQRGYYLKMIKYHIWNAQNRSSGEMKSYIIETYKNEW